MKVPLNPEQLVQLYKNGPPDTQQAIAEIVKQVGESIVLSDAGTPNELYWLTRIRELIEEEEASRRR